MTVTDGCDILYPYKFIHKMDHLDLSAVTKQFTTADKYSKKIITERTTDYFSASSYNIRPNYIVRINFILISINQIVFTVN